ncbi:MAG: hypothetical protein J6T10_19300 [Methanobrevibacter sp.]|nr:hypothetical protein [Methanobrevibacter sp.]
MKADELLNLMKELGVEIGAASVTYNGKIVSEIYAKRGTDNRMTFCLFYNKKEYSTIYQAKKFLLNQIAEVKKSIVKDKINEINKDFKDD